MLDAWLFVQLDVMVDTGPGRDDLRWHRQCIRTVGGITAGWALVHLPSLAARLVHALVKLLAATGRSHTSEPEAKGTRSPWSFLTATGFVAPWDNKSNENGNGQRRTRGESMGTDDRRSRSGSSGGREREGLRQRRARATKEEASLAELQDAGLEVRGPGASAINVYGFVLSYSVQVSEVYQPSNMCFTKSHVSGHLSV